MRGDLCRQAEVLMLMPAPLILEENNMVAVDTDLRLIRGNHISKYELTTDNII